MCNIDTNRGESLQNLQRRPTKYHCEGSW